MKLEGSCHCGAVRFNLESKYPFPYKLCYCAVCRKTAGSGGFAINIAGEYATLEVEGKEHVATYHAAVEGETGGIARNFCRLCGSPLWLWDPLLPNLVQPHASAIDSELPEPPDHVHMMLAEKAEWVPVLAADEDELWEEYPDESVAEWHARHGLEG